MPPLAPCPSDDDTSAEGGFTLADVDVQIIYEILRLAQEADTFASQPFHAIFPAYRDILARHDITSSNDRTYLRFLYKLEQQRSPTQTLFEAFEQRLAQLGIEMVFSSDNGTDGDTRALFQRENNEFEGPAGSREPRENFQPPDTQGPIAIWEVHNGGILSRRRPHAEHAEDMHDLRPRSRRASFSSFMDFEEYTKPRVRAESRSSASRLQRHSRGLGQHRPSEQSSLACLGESGRPDQDHGGRSSENGDDLSRAENSGIKQMPGKAAKEDSNPTLGPKTQQPLAIAMPSRKKPRQQIFEIYTTGTDTVDEASNMEDRNTARASVPFRSPSETQLIRDADTFDYFRKRDMARTLLRRWKDRSTQREWEGNILSVRAVQFNHDMLLRRTVVYLKHAYQLRQHLKHAEEIFALWETRARKARDTYLLTKAFTHWAASTTEETQRSSTARRHILRIKFFNAWREVTAVNQLKAQRKILAKFYYVWKQKFVLTWIHDNKASAVNQEKLIETMYWTWFWKFCEERAPQWRNALLKRRYLLRMFDAVIAKKELASAVLEMRDRRLIYRFWNKWHSQWEDCLEHEKQASMFRQAQTVGRAIPQWQRQLKLAPAAQQVMQKATAKLISSAVLTWIMRTKMQQQARRVNKGRMLRNAWTTWNDRLRLEVLQQQINERLTVEALYRWVLAERFLLMKRLHEERSIQRSFRSFIENWETKKLLLADASNEATRLSNNRLKQGILLQWYRSSRCRFERREFAVRHDATRAISHGMQQLHAKYEHQLEISRWAVEALFYIRASHAIKTWQSSILEQRRRKIQAAYSKVRIKQKKKQAMAILQVYQDQMELVRTFEATANNFREESLKITTRQIIAKWLSKLKESRLRTEAATGRKRAVILSTCVDSWTARMRLITQQNTQAVSYAHLHVEKITYENLRKLQLRVLELRNLEAKASTIHSWNSKRYARKWLRLWANDALGRRDVDTITASIAHADHSHWYALAPNLSSTSSVTVSGQATRQDRFPRSLATGSVSPPPSQTRDASPPITMLPLPGYLSTPSKRAARARAIANEFDSFTPATDPHAMRRAQVLHLTHEGIDATRHLFAEGQKTAQPLVRTLFTRSGNVSTNLGLEHDLQSSSTSAAAPLRPSRMGLSHIPRSAFIRSREMKERSMTPHDTKPRD